MKFNLKVILLGGLAFYVTQFIVSMGAGPLIHQGVLEEIYRANEGFWRPELNMDPPDMAALMPLWLTTGVIIAFIMAGIFDNIRSAFDGSATVKGVKFGVVAFLFAVSMNAAWSGIFNLPYEIWVWWSVESLVVYLVSGAVLGLVTAKLSPG